MTTPVFNHDCDKCIWLGTYQDSALGMTDLYVHPEGHRPTVISRFSSEGPDYQSGLSFGYGSSEALTEARVRAQQKGLLEYNVYEALYHVSPENEQCARELVAALPFTEEYQAWLAFERGDLHKSKALLGHLVELAYARRLRLKAPDATRSGAAWEIESRLVKVLSWMLGSGRPDREVYERHFPVILLLEAFDEQAAA